MRPLAVMKRILLEMLRDKRTLALIFIMPIMILSLVYILFNGERVPLKLGVKELDENLVDRLEEADITVIQYEGEIDHEKHVIADGLDGFLVIVENDYELIVHNDDPLRSGPLKMKVNQALQTQVQDSVMNKVGPLDYEDVSVDVTYIYGSGETEFFDVLSTMLIGFFVFFFVFLLSGIGFFKRTDIGHDGEINVHTDSSF